MDQLKNLSKYQIAIFFLLSFIITWTAQILAYQFAAKNNYPLTNEANLLHLLNFLQGNLTPSFIPYFLLFTFSFGPTIAGIIVTALFKGRQGLRNLVSQLIRINITIKWYLFALIIPISLCLTSLAVGFILNGFQPIRYDFLLPISLSIPLLLYMIFFTGLAEEVGWRGYALPELQKKYSAEKSSWILGIVWGLWHLPANLAMPFFKGELTIPFVIIIILALTFGIVGWTIVLTWFYNNTKSLFLIILIHGLTNTLQSYLILSSNNSAANMIFGILPWAIAIYLLKKYGSQKLLTKN